MIKKNMRSVIWVTDGLNIFLHNYFHLHCFLFNVYLFTVEKISVSNK